MCFFRSEGVCLLWPLSAAKGTCGSWSWSTSNVPRCHKLAYRKELHSGYSNVRNRCLLQILEWSSRGWAWYRRGIWEKGTKKEKKTMEHDKTAPGIRDRMAQHTGNFLFFYIYLGCFFLFSGGPAGRAEKGRHEGSLYIGQVFPWYITSLLFTFLNHIPRDSRSPKSRGRIPPHGSILPCHICYLWSLLLVLALNTLYFYI